MIDRSYELPKILAVDDVPANLVAIESCLEHMDATVIGAHSGQEALSKLLKHDFALVLLDVQMPGMDGFETASLIRSDKATSGLPIMFMTAFTKDEQHVLTGYKLGAVDYLFKPLVPEILRAKARAFLDLYLYQREHAEDQRAMARYAAALEQSNEELEQFAYVASHDLQEPLRKVSVFCQLLQDSCGDRIHEDERIYMQHAVEGAKRMKTLIADLLAFSRVGSRGEALQQVSAAAALDDALYNLSSALEENQVRLEIERLPQVMADARQLVQLFQNLIGNAIKYRCPERTPQIVVSAVPQEALWRFSVADNGIGIATEYFDRIFEVFKRLHSREEYEGTGIGLALCKKIVKRFGGDIWVESTEGEGTTFYFTLAMPASNWEI